MTSILDIEDTCLETELDTSAPFVYQNMVCCGLRPIVPDRYISVLEGSCRRVFGEELRMDMKSLGNDIERRLYDDGYRSDAVNFISVRVYEGGRTVLHPLGTSMYDSWGLRALRPSVVAFRNACFPDQIEPSSLCLCCATYLGIEAVRRGARQGIALDSDGKVLGIGCHPLVISMDGGVFCQKCHAGVELGILEDALKRMGRRLETRDIHYEDLKVADELMYIDHEGLTSVSGCDSMYYSDVLAASLGRKIGDIFANLKTVGFGPRHI